MAVEIDQLSETELRALNRQIVERLKFLQSVKAYQSMMRFDVGSTVGFETDEGKIHGTLVKFNKKTVTVITKDNQRWNVSPQLLSLVKDIDDEPGEDFLTTTNNDRGK